MLAESKGEPARVGLEDLKRSGKNEPKARTTKGSGNLERKVMSRRTETAYKAKSPGKSAEHDKASGLGDMVNAAIGVFLQSLICITKDHVLIPLKGALKRVRWRPVRYASNSRWRAPSMATCLVHGQESAEGHSCSLPADQGLNPEKGKGPSSSISAMNPTGGAVGRGGDGIPNSDEYLLERILSRANLSGAWKQVKANRGVPGVDDMPIDNFMAYAWEHWPEIGSSIFAESYKPLPVEGGRYPKGNTGHAPFGDTCSS